MAFTVILLAKLHQGSPLPPTVRIEFTEDSDVYGPRYDILLLPVLLPVVSHR